MNILHHQSSASSPEPEKQEDPEKIRERLEQQKEEKEASEKLAEFESLQEQVSKNAPTQTNDPVKQANQALQDLPADDNKKNEPLPEEPLNETDEVPQKDLSWVKKAEDIIKKDKDKPYEEEEDAEKLQEDYLNKNFKLKVDMDDKKIND